MRNYIKEIYIVCRWICELCKYKICVYFDTFLEGIFCVDDSVCTCNLDLFKCVCIMILIDNVVMQTLCNAKNYRSFRSHHLPQLLSYGLPSCEKLPFRIVSLFAQWSPIPIHARHRLWLAAS